jgi:thymidylate kinase
MIAGEPYLKGYRLPWEDMLLAGRRWDAEHGVYVSAPEAELLLLLTRAALKLRSRDRLRAALGRPYFRGGLRREYDWLVERSDGAAVVALIRGRLGDGPAAVVEAAFARRTISDAEIFAFRRAAWPLLRRYRTYGAAEARLRRWWREARSLWYRLAKRGRTPASLYRRGPVGGGVVIALLGADGSGKSTHCRALVSWLGWKADVMPVYLGSGDGPGSLRRRALNFFGGLAARARRALRGGAADGSEGGAAGGGSGHGGRRQLKEASILRRSWLCLWAVTLAQERLAKLRRAFRARNRGMIVVADRYPQSEVMGYNDGPLLNDLRAAAAPWGSLARWEARLYAEMALLQPDLVLKLTLSPEVALARKPSTPAEQVRLKTEAVRQLRFADSARVLSIDAGGPLDEVSLAVKRAVWDAL